MSLLQSVTTPFTAAASFVHHSLNRFTQLITNHELTGAALTRPIEEFSTRNFHCITEAFAQRHRLKTIAYVAEAAIGYLVLLVPTAVGLLIKANSIAALKNENDFSKIFLLSFVDNSLSGMKYVSTYSWSNGNLFEEMAPSLRLHTSITFTVESQEKGKRDIIEAIDSMSHAFRRFYWKAKAHKPSPQESGRISVELYRLI